MKKLYVFLLIFIGILAFYIFNYLMINKINPNVGTVVQNKLVPISICEEVLKYLNTTPEKVYVGKFATVNFSNFPHARTFYTQITEQSAKGPNFAGHYVFVQLGCGTVCTQFTIVDSTTGKIVIYPETVFEDVLPSFNLNSNLLIFNAKGEFDYLNDKNISDVLGNNIEAGFERTYFQLNEDEDGSVRLDKVCTENYLDGLVDENGYIRNSIE